VGWSDWRRLCRTHVGLPKDEVEEAVPVFVGLLGLHTCSQAHVRLAESLTRRSYV